MSSRAPLLSSRAKPRDLRRSPTATALFTDAPARPHRLTGVGRYPGDGRGYHRTVFPWPHSFTHPSGSPDRPCRHSERSEEPPGHHPTTPIPLGPQAGQPPQRLTGVGRYPGDGRGYLHPQWRPLHERPGTWVTVKPGT